MDDAVSYQDVRPAPEGWVLQRHGQTFSGHAGPFYFREEGGPPGVGFFTKPYHANLGGIVHGGALMTLADMALFDVCFRKLGRFPAVTITMNSEFLSPAPIGVFVEASGELVRAGRKMCFVRGLVTAEAKTVLAFSGTLKRLSPASQPD